MLDKHKLQRLEEFKQQLVDTKLVNKEAILSVEGIVGAGVITSKRNINLYSDMNTPASLTETIDIVEEIISTTKRELTITNIDVLRTIDMTKFSIERLIACCNDLKNISKEVLDMLMAESIRHFYGEEDRLCDIHELDIFQVMSVHSNYIGKVLKTDTQEGIDVFNRLYDKLASISIERYSEYKILPLLSTLLYGDISETYSFKKIDVREITFKDFVKNISNLYNNISKLQDLKVTCENDYRMLRDKNYESYRESATDLDGVHNTYSQFNDFISHNESKDVISLLGILSKIK